MGIIVLLISISVTIAVGFVFVFYWNMKSGQYDDTYTPSVRMLFDEQKSSARPIDELKNKPSSSKNCLLEKDKYPGQIPDKNQEIR